MHEYQVFEQSRPGRTLDTTTHRVLHTASTQNHDRQQVAEDANPTEDRVDV